MKMNGTAVSATLVLTLNFLGGVALAFNEAPAAPVRVKKEVLYTGLGFAGGGIWVASAVKADPDRFPEPRLQRYQKAGAGFDQEWVLESKLFRGREVRAVLPMKTPQGAAAIGVVTQWSVEQGDEPEIHAIALSEAFKKGPQPWVKLAKSPCVDIEAIRVDAARVSFQCSDEQVLDPKTRKIVKRPVDAKLKDPHALDVSGWSFEPRLGEVPIPLRTQDIPASGDSPAQVAGIRGPDWGWNEFIVMQKKDPQGKPVFEKKLSP